MASSRPIVVALIDSGINVYHEAFRGGSPNVPGVQASPVVLSKEGEHAELVERDAPTWSALEEGILYAFPGTRVLGISFGGGNGSPILDTNGHGTATASLLAWTAPDVVIVSVQIHGVYCIDRPGECVVDPSVADAMQWVSEQPWIDVVSLSLAGLPAKPRVSPIEPESERFIAASRAAADAGMLIVNGAGNHPVSSTSDYFPGVPWVIAVGGSQGAKHGATVVNNKLFDVAANVTAEVAREDSTTDTYWTAGTSMSTPVVAGTLAIAKGALAGSPRADLLNDPTTLRETLRDMLNASATRWGPTDYTPLAQQDPDPVLDWVDPAVPVVAGPAQLGWGHVDGTTGLLMADVLWGRAELPAAPAEYSAFMAQYQAHREMLWER